MAQPIAARHIVDAILDELEAQGFDQGGAGPNGTEPTIQINGQVDVRALAVRIVNLINDR